VCACVCVLRVYPELRCVCRCRSDDGLQHAAAAGFVAVPVVGIGLANVTTSPASVSSRLVSHLSTSALSRSLVSMSSSLIQVSFDDSMLLSGDCSPVSETFQSNRLYLVHLLNGLLGLFLHR